MRPNRNNMRERDSSPMIARLKAMVRRVVVDNTSGVLWRVLGFEGLGAGELETDDAELFDNIGHHARPPATGRPEVIRVNVGGDPNNTVIIGSRDRATLDAVLQALNSADVLGADETLLYNSQAVVHISGSTVSIKTPGGTAVDLATKQDVQDVVDAINDGVPGGADGGAAYQTSMGALLSASGTPNGTSVLKGE